MYRCAKCNEPVRNVNAMGLQCEKCGSKIFFKERPSVKKVLKSDRSMLRATLTVEGPEACAVAESVGPEAGRELPRTGTSVKFRGDAAEILIEAADASAMRAALNSYLECIIVVQNVEHIAKVRQ